MHWIKRIAGVFMLLIGLIWIGQGIGLLPGSMMSGHPIYALLGLLVGAVGFWLFASTRGVRAAR